MEVMRREDGCRCAMTRRMRDWHAPCSIRFQSIKLISDSRWQVYSDRIFSTSF